MTTVLCSRPIRMGRAVGSSLNLNPLSSAHMVGRFGLVVTVVPSEKLPGVLDT